jgi:peptidoglycan/LPS O-acetylase OafA/YrhL
VPDVDARILRLQQGVVTVVLLAGFVFSIEWLIPVAAVLPALDAALGRSGPTPTFWRVMLASRLGPAKTWETAAAARFQALIVFAALIVATLLVLAGVDTVATVLAILVAGVGAACATGLFGLGAELDRQTKPRRRGGPGRQPGR